MDEVYRTDSSTNIQEKLDNIAESLALKYKKKSLEDQTDIKPFLELTQ